MISTKEAATIAKKHGLTLADVPALVRLADTTAEAEEVASMFSPNPVQLTRADLAGMSAEQIVEAQSAGLLDEIQGIKP